MSLIIEKRGRVVCIQLHRPRVLNAINSEMMHKLISTVRHYDRRQDVGCFVLHGHGKAFSAGADIRELEQKSWREVSSRDMFAEWDAFTSIRTPKLAAVNGYALGGGCELAMMCDVIYAADNAVFGQPELKLGVIPGMGGTQRLTRLVGRAVAMDMILSGRTLNAEEALQLGLAARVFPAQNLLEEVQTIAQTIAGFGRGACMAAVEAVNRADETSLQEGLLAERRSYHALWNTQDKRIGMQAFLQKKKPDFRGY